MGKQPNLNFCALPSRFRRKGRLRTHCHTSGERKREFDEDKVASGRWKDLEDEGGGGISHLEAVGMLVGYVERVGTV